MKKLFSLVAALVLAVGMFAADIVGPIAGTLTKQGATLATGLTVNDNRGGFIVNNDGVFFCNQTTGKLKKADLALTAIADADTIGKGLFMDEDETGNKVIWVWTVGSTKNAYAQVYGPQNQLLRVDTLGILARTDFTRAAGNFVTGRGAYFAHGNGLQKMLRYNLVDGKVTTVDTIALPFAGGGPNPISVLDVDHFTAHGRGAGVALIDMSGETPVVTNMPYFTQTGTFCSTAGATIFKLAGHTLIAMGTYPVQGYKGSFAIYDVTDPAAPYVIAEDKEAAGTASMNSTATFRVIVDGDVATIYEYASYAVRKYTLTVAPACFMKQGNEGAEWESMTAGENGIFTLEGIYAADSLWINGSAADEGATLYKKADITYNGTVLVKDTVKFTYDGVNKKMTIDSLGHFIPTLTFNVNIPEGTPSCFIYGNFTNKSFIRMKKLTDRDYTYTYRAEDALAESVKYLYAAGEGDAYLEDLAAERTYMEKDTVLKFKAVPVAQKIEYELNGGVTNDYGWTSKGAVAMEIQNAFNAAAGAKKEFVKMEDGKYYYMIGENWVEESAAAGQACTVTGFLQNVTYNEKNYLKTVIETTEAAKLGWLKDVMVAARTAAELSVADADMVENTYRKELSAFLLCSPAETSWPAAPSYAIAGQAESFMPIWKHGFVNPESVNAEFTLNAPYKAGFTFDGWYTTADFSGDKVTKIDPKTASGKLYAKWIEYIPTIAEVVALADDTETNVSGIVNYIQGKNIYIQDATGGILVFTSADPTCKVGQKIVAKGVKTVYGGAPEVKNAEVASAEDAEVYAPVKFETLSALTAEPLKYFAQRVSISGVKIVSYDSYKNPFVTDGTDTIQCYRMSLDETQFPIGTKVTVTAVAGYFNKFQFVGDVAGIEKVVVGKKDSYAYPARGENGEYTLENNWVISNIEDNFEANKPGPTDNVRGMAAKDGKMYFINRANASITVVDGATGNMLDPIAIKGEHLFEVADSTGKWSAAVTLAYNDIKFDGAGNCLIGCCTGTNSWFFVYKVDLTTGEATELVKEHLYSNPNFKDNGFRFDAFGVYGDVNNSAIIMATDANSFNAYKWDITNGKAANAEEIICTIDPKTDQSLLIADGALSVASFGTAPQTFPVSEDLFYVDGWSTLPMLFDMSGSLKDDFVNSPKGVAVVNNEGDTCKMNTGHNGLVEFQVGDEYFLLMAATNTVGTPTSAFALYKFADEAKEFAGLEPMWYFPANGMGAATNGCRTAVPSVEVKGNVATLYIYANNNGYAVYTFTGKEGTGVDNIDAVKIEAKKVVENGQIYIIKNGVKYTVLGAVAK